MMKFSIAALAMFPITAQAEVTDKVPTILELWGFGVVVAIILLFLVRRYRLAVAAGVLLVGIYVYAILDIVNDPFVGPAIIEEQGKSYLAASYGSIVLMVLGIIVGIYLNLKRDKNAL